MAWLLGLADKAENLLDKIDQNTAAALKKNNDDVEQRFREVAWVTTEASTLQNAVIDTSNMMSESPLQSPQVSVIDIQRTTSVINTDTVQCSITQIENSFSNMIIPVKVPLTSSADNDGKLLLASERSSPNLSHNSIEIPYGESVDTCLDENYINFPNRTQNIHTTVFENAHGEQQLVALQRDYKYELATNGCLDKQQTDYQKELNTLKKKVENSEAEKKKLFRELADLRLSLDRNRSELNSTQSELEQHRARASKTLLEKEKLIAELRNNASTGLDDVTLIEINQLREERRALREENQQICEQLRLTRQELISVETKLEQIRKQSTENNIKTQEAIILERRRRLDAEEDAKMHIEEIRSLKEEHSLLRNKFSTKSRRQETEISRLRTQLSAMSTPSSEVESRLSTLTQTLVSKQQALENLTTERNALRLQLEKVEQEYRSSNSWQKNVPYNNVNDTDDAKAKVPIFLMETPFDTGVARRMKRAYSLLDTISIRTGVFLRRYPLARILVFIYMAVLQLWVLVVLLSQSPDAH